MTKRVLCVDPGEKRIGLALSDESGTIANPLKVLNHVSRLLDAAAVAEIAVEHDVRCIVVGLVVDDLDFPGPQTRKGLRMAEAIRSQTELPVEIWDEYGSTQQAQLARRQLGVTKKRRSGHMDDLAAAVILQSYLDAHR